MNNNIDKINNNEDLKKYIELSTKSVSKKQYEKYYDHVVNYYDAIYHNPHIDLV